MAMAVGVGDGAVSLAALGILSYVLRDVTKALRNLKSSVDKNTKVVKTGAQVNVELHTFMKSLNGKLAKATIQTVKEQKVEHQHIDKVITEGS